MTRTGNEGKVKGETDSVGGNIGNNGYNGTIGGHCNNFEKVTGQDCVGGNVGSNEGIIDGNCENKKEGAVKGRGISVGGNIGYNGIYGKMCMGYCKNEALVDGERKVGGNVGRNNGSMNMTYCVNGKIVKGKEEVENNVGEDEGCNISHLYG